ncbi:MAG: hypothetical protein U9N59_09000 [Campylobacterota bacterium]|nr:hypothetical protein [Campylobacterota bacterium]
MKNIIILLILCSSLVIASSNESDSEKKIRVEKQIKEEIEKEKKYANEQKFYRKDNYDFKRSEVNQESLSTIPEIEIDDLDMNSVYD